MKRIVLEVSDTTHEKLMALSLVNQIGFSRLIDSLFEKSELAKNLYNDWINLSCQEINSQKENVYDTRS